MFERIANSWELVKASVVVLRADKELLVFPILSSIALVLVSIGFVLPLIAAGAFEALLSGGTSLGQVASFLVGFAYYFVQYFVILFANTALVGAALIRLRGGDPTVGDGLRIAVQRLPQLTGYALIAATVGVILRALARRRSALGRIAVSLIGLAWNLATFLVVPVLVAEGVGPIQAIRRSVDLLRRTWGEQIAGNLSISLIFGLIGIVTTVGVLAVVGLLSVAFETPIFLLLLLLILVPVYLLLGLVSSTLNGIFAAAVYRYAAEGDPGDLFQPELVQGAFRAAAPLR